MNKNISVKELISKQVDMDVLEFFIGMECKFNHKIYREIQLNMKKDKKGKLYKQPIGEKNNLTIEQLKSYSRGFGNALSLYTKHIPDLYVVDFDTKEDLDNCELYNELISSNTPYTETNKGFHFYIYITSIDKYSNEKKIYIDDKYEIDLIGKINNIWEMKGRKVINGDNEIKKYWWGYLRKFFNEEKMNFHDENVKEKVKKETKKKVINQPVISPPISPLTSDEEVENIIVEDNRMNINELKDLVMKIKNKYDYDNWINIGRIIHKETGGSTDGKNLYHEWSKLDSQYNPEVIEYNWKYWRNNKCTELSVGTLKYFVEDENPSNRFKKAFFISCKKVTEEDGSIVYKGKADYDALVNELNKELIFIKETGEFVILDVSYEGEDIWYLKKTTATKEHFKRFTFPNELVPEKTPINPFDIWIKHIKRRQVRKIGFNPRNPNDPDIFNLWAGYKISKQEAELYDVTTAQPILDHLLKRWCSNNPETYEYVLNYFSHIIQKPYMKTGVVLTLKSDEGAGKGIIFNILQEIIGENHYVQINNIDQCHLYYQFDFHFYQLL